MNSAGYHPVTPSPKKPSTPPRDIETRAMERESFVRTDASSPSKTWRRPGASLRDHLVREDEGGNAFVLSPNCRIEKYHKVAEKVLNQFLQHPIETRDELLEAYLVGIRLSKFLTEVLPTHPDYDGDDPTLATARRRSETFANDLKKYLEEIALMIDREEHEAYVSRVLRQRTQAAMEEKSYPDDENQTATTRALSSSPDSTTEGGGEDATKQSEAWTWSTASTTHWDSAWAKASGAKRSQKKGTDNDWSAQSWSNFSLSVHSSQFDPEPPSYSPSLSRKGGPSKARDRPTSSDPVRSSAATPDLSYISADPSTIAPTVATPDDLDPLRYEERLLPGSSSYSDDEADENETTSLIEQRLNSARRVAGERRPMQENQMVEQQWDEQSALLPLSVKGPGGGDSSYVSVRDDMTLHSLQGRLTRRQRALNPFKQCVKCLLE